MSQIISVSLNEKSLKELDFLIEKIGYSGRSEALRAGIRALQAREHEIDSFFGKQIQATLIVVHDHSHDLEEAAHRHSGLISTHLHSHLDYSGECLDIFIIKGLADRVKDLMKDLETDKRIQQFKLMVC